MANTIGERTRRQTSGGGSAEHFLTLPRDRHFKHFCNFAAQTLKHPVMTATELDNLWDFLQGLNLSAEDRLWLSERLRNDNDSNEELLQSEERTVLQWFREHHLGASSTDWNCKSAWDKLTPENREVARKLNLSPEDIDERTFNILSK